MEGNISIVMHDICDDNQVLDCISHDDIIQHIQKHIQDKLNANDDIHTLLACEMHYTINHTLKSLRRIADYYDIPHKRTKKAKLIEAIVAFESDNNNTYLVMQRRVLWAMIGIIQNDKHLNKYIMLD